jgi:quercetin dioxygenase-like cupin family protein
MPAMPARATWFRVTLLAPLLGVTAGALLSFAVTYAQLPPGVNIEPIGQGEAAFADAVGGPTDVALARVTLAPGSTSGWHSHPGPGWVVVTAGEVTVYYADRCQEVYSAGSAFGEDPWVIHEARNETGAPVELLISFTVPAGVPVLTPEAGSSAGCR